jgi:hypothetical protein
MLLIKATLLQDIGEYLAIIEEPLQRIIAKQYNRSHSFDNDFRRAMFDEVLLWIICEELELIHGLFEDRHVHNKTPHTVFHQELSRILHVPLSILTNWYVKAPRLYGSNNQIRVRIKNRDLYIDYYRSMPD